MSATMKHGKMKISHTENGKIGLNGNKAKWVKFLKCSWALEVTTTNTLFQMIFKGMKEMYSQVSIFCVLNY